MSQYTHCAPSRAGEGPNPQGSEAIYLGRSGPTPDCTGSGGRSFAGVIIGICGRCHGTGQCRCDVCGGAAEVEPDTVQELTTYSVRVERPSVSSAANSDPRRQADKKSLRDIVLPPKPPNRAGEMIAPFFER